MPRVELFGDVLVRLCDFHAKPSHIHNFCTSTPSSPILGVLFSVPLDRCFVPPIKRVKMKPDPRLKMNVNQPLLPLCIAGVPPVPAAGAPVRAHRFLLPRPRAPQAAATQAHASTGMSCITLYILSHGLMCAFLYTHTLVLPALLLPKFAPALLTLSRPRARFPSCVDARSWCC